MTLHVDKQLCIGLSLSPTWLKGAGWRREDSRAEQIFSSSFYTDLARQAERAKLDFVFKPDVMALPVETLERSPGFGGLDPSLLLAALAQSTRHIGLVTTVSSTFTPPYLAARQAQSLNWISQGRAGLNIVTAIDGAANFGLRDMPPSEERYAKATEFTQVVHQLWNSFPGEAMIVDRNAGQFADPSRILPIDHQGNFFRVQGPLNLPTYPAGEIPLIQAGASAAGLDFAAAAADGVFAAAPDMAASFQLRQSLQSRARKIGRSPEAIRVLPGMHFFLAHTRNEALDLHRETHAHLSVEQRYASIQALLGIDMRHFAPDQPITLSLLPDPPVAVRSRTHTDLLRALIEREQPTVQELIARPEVVNSGHWVVIGTVEDALKEILAWHEAGAMDGFIALPGGSSTSLQLFFEELIPRLAERGLFRREYKGNTLREHLGIV